MTIQQPSKRKPFCKRCYGSGIYRDKSPGPYTRCPCGRQPNAWASGKMAAQSKRLNRLDEIKREGWE